MKIHLSKVSAIVASFFLVGAMSLTSCKGGQASQQEIESLQNKLDSIMVQYERVKATAGEQADNGQLAKKDSTIEAQAKEIQGLLNRLKQAQRAKLSADASSESGATLRNQQKQLRQKESEINNLQKQLKEQQSQLAELQRSSDKGVSASGDVAALTKQIREQQSKIDDLSSQLENSNKSLNITRQQCDQDAERLGGQITGLQRQVNDLQNQLEEAQGVLKNMPKTDDNATEVARLKGQVKSLNGQVDDLNAQVSALNKKLAEADKQAQSQKNDLQKDANAESAALQAQLKKAQDELASCQAQQQQLSSQIEDLRKEAKNNVNLQGEAAESAKTIADLQKTVADQQRQIADLQAQVKAKEAELKNAAKESKSANKGAVSEKLAELQALCDSYVEQIAQLKAENEQLKAENATLKETNQQAQQVIAENAELVKKVELASVLVTSEVTAQGGKSISGTVLKETTKAKQVKVVRVNAHILANNVITPGSVTIYARIANAANRVVCNGNPSDYTFDMGGVPMQYTLSQDIEFTGAARNISMVWRKFESVTLEPGLYWVTLYANGYEIGKASFTLE